MTSPFDPLGATLSDWETLASSWALPRYRARQIFDALHRRGLREWRAVQELPGSLRERLESEIPIRLPEIARRVEDRSLAFGGPTIASSRGYDSVQSAATGCSSQRRRPRPACRAPLVPVLTLAGLI